MHPQIRVLVVDDDEPHAQAVAESLERVGYECAVATSGREGLRLIEEQTYDIILTDLIMDGVGGLEILGKAKQELPDAEVVILTGHGTIKTAVTAMQAGATTYLTKPLDIGELRTVVDKASQSQRLARSNLELRRQLNEKFGFEGVVGNSPLMHAVIDRLRQIAPTSATVLIVGESGTGKELVAKALHVNGPRRNKPFVPLNCAALSENILESELFGHIKGAFTGADRERKGVFEHANGGTLFLDEVGGHPPGDAGQAAARAGVGRDRAGRDQRAVQGQRAADLGDPPRPARGDRHRIVPPGPVSPPEGRQRQAPPARARREDIPLLIDAFLKEFTKAHDKTIAAVSPAARKALARTPGPATSGSCATRSRAWSSWTATASSTSTT
jgi:two-component system response regulator HydG